MISNQEIQGLIKCPKYIYKKEPKNKYKEERGQRKSTLFLKSNQDLLKKSKIKESEILNQSPAPKKLDFKVFIRQNQEFTDNFSIGLVFKGLNLIRYNGAHDSGIVEDNKKDKKEHHPIPHIHLMTEENINSGSSNPKPQKVEKTKKYNNMEEGLLAFFKDLKISNWPEYFPNLHQRSLL